MTSEKRLLRSRKSLVGGVCAGVADYFDVDPVIVRILVVVFTFASAGLLAVPYVAMWVVVPLEPKEVLPLDVQPQAVHSETYGAVDVDASRKAEQGAPKGASAAQAAGWHYTHPSYTSAAHVPPEPPAGATRTRPIPTPPATPVPPGNAQDAQQASFTPPTPSAYEGWASQHAHQPLQPPAEPSRTGVRAALWVGSFLLFFGVSAMVASMVEDVAWWQYWPLIFVILGIVRMVVPGEEGHRMRKFVDGLIAFGIGSVLLTMSLGVLAWESIELMLTSLWPLLLVVLGLLLLGGALKSPSLTLLAGVLFVGFCVAGVVWYLVPGATEEFVVSTPYGRDYRFDVQPWEGFERGEAVSTFTIA